MKTITLTKKEIMVIVDALNCPSICSCGCSIEVGEKMQCETCWVNKMRYDLVERLS